MVFMQATHVLKIMWYYRRVVKLLTFQLFSFGTFGI